MSAEPRLYHRDRELWRLSAAQLGDAYRSGALSPVQVLEAVQQRIAEKNPQLNALVTPNPAVTEEARASARRWAEGAPLSPSTACRSASRTTFRCADCRRPGARSCCGISCPPSTSCRWSG
ncbi:hypothetical protein [Marinobacterium aestuariivivens]|uniref:Amidase domain-containing protein n=1 Tax=Marinobacterium aestuariivivens TaxID=1698799 RepID=A0ABW2A2C1_9GAMM